MSTLTIFIFGAIVFATTVYGAVMGAGVALTRRFYRENGAYASRPGFEEAGAGQPEEVQTDDS